MCPSVQSNDAEMGCGSRYCAGYTDPTTLIVSPGQVVMIDADYDSATQN